MSDAYYARGLLEKQSLFTVNDGNYQVEGQAFESAILALHRLEDTEHNYELLVDDSFKFMKQRDELSRYLDELAQALGRISPLISDGIRIRKNAIMREEDNDA